MRKKRKGYLRRKDLRNRRNRYKSENYEETEFYEDNDSYEDDFYEDDYYEDSGFDKDAAGDFYEDNEFYEGSEFYGESDFYEENAVCEDNTFIEGVENAVYADEEEFYADNAFMEGMEDNFYTEEEEFYADEEEEFYADEEEEFYADEEDAFYADEEEFYADEEEFYADEESAFYADEEEFYADEEEDFYTDESNAFVESNAFTEGMEDDYYEDEEESNPHPRKSHKRTNVAGRRKRKPQKKGQKKGENKVAAFLTAAADKIYHLPVMDKVLLGTGAAVIAIAVVTCGIYANVKSVDAQVASFVDAGERLQSIGIVGESGLLALTNAEIAMMNAVQEAEEPQEEEKEEQESFAIGIHMTSVEKDLKIKIIDTGTGKLIKGIPFQVEVTDPAKKSAVWTDDDKDGIIYHKDITPGQYEVSLVKIDELSGYSFTGKALSVTVKDKIEYKQIDVADEIKTEAEVNAAVEDTAQQTETEEVLQDTVEWVISTKTEIGTDDSVSYEEVKKSNIPDPTVSAGLFKMQAFSAVDMAVAASEEETDDRITGVSIDGPGELTVGETITLTATVEGEGNYNKTVTWSSSDTSVATVKNGAVTGIGAGSVMITAKTADDTIYGSVNITVKEKLSVITGVNISGAKDITVGESVTLTAVVEGEGNFDKTVTWSSSDTSVATVKNGAVTGVSAGSVMITAKSANDTIYNSVNITVKEKAAVVTAVKVSGPSSVEVGSTITLSAHVEGMNRPSGEVTWSSANNSIAAVTDKGEVTGIAEGKVKITATSKTDSSMAGSLEITVTGKNADITIKIPDKLTVYTDKTGELTAVVTGSADSVAWKSSDPKIAKVTETGEKATVTGVKAGTATITAVYGGKEATCKVTVMQDPKTDKTTILKDKDGNTLYIKDSKGNYVKATYADYYTATAFYKQVKNVKYRYTGWQTLDGKTYFFDKNGNPVTGEQVILGAKYVFASDGALVTGSGTMGIDVSKWNGSINWNAVRDSGVSYVIIRCGYRGSSTGALIEDPMFKKNIQGASAAGLKVGIYFFTQAVTEVEAVEEASMTINLIKQYGIAYPVFIDVEGSGGRADGLGRDARTNIVNAYCKTIQSAGYKAGIYANKTWLESKMNMSALNQYKIWLAQYNAQYTYKGKVDLWQYSSGGTIGGINGRVDMNISYLGY